MLKAAEKIIILETHFVPQSIIFIRIYRNQNWLRQWTFYYFSCCFLANTVAGLQTRPRDSPPCGQGHESD